MRQHLTTADMVLMTASACLIVVSYVLAGTTSSQGNEVLVQVDGTTLQKMSLSEAGSTVVKGLHGSLTVEIREGRVSITRADCPNHVCMKTGWRSRAGEVIVCVPNKTVVRVLGEQKAVRATTG